MKIKDYLKACPCCKNKFIFSPESEEAGGQDDRGNDTDLSDDEEEESDSESENARTELSTATNDQDTVHSSGLQLAKNVKDDVKRKNKPIKPSYNAEAEFLAMSSTQMDKQLDTIKRLVEENNSMKEQIQNKIVDLNHFKFMANEFESSMKESSAKCIQYKQIMLQTQQTFKSQSMFTSNSTVQMQKLIAELTNVVITRDEELALQAQLSRQLKESLDEATRSPEERDQNFLDFMEEKKR